MRTRSCSFFTALVVAAILPGIARAADHAIEHRGAVGQRFVQECAPGFGFGAVWGSDVYTDDSHICTAAVHAGLITQEGGGRVTYEMREGLASYPAVSRNGVNTASWGAWLGSFVLVGAEPGGGGGGGGGTALACGLGEYWDVVDTGGAWLGTWVPTSESTLDGYWTRPGEPEFVAPLTLSVDAAGHVLLYRDDPEPNKFTTTDCSYEGQLQPDGVTVTGTVVCNSGVGVLGPYDWYATIVCG